MAKGTYIGVNGVPRKITSGHIGVNGVARKIKKVYIGVGGVARLCWSGTDLITFKIDGVDYQAESGWTWSDWVYSAHNTDGYYLDDAEGWVCNQFGTAIFDANTWEYPLADQTIPANGQYASSEF